MNHLYVNLPESGGKTWDEKPFSSHAGSAEYLGWTFDKAFFSFFLNTSSPFC